MAGVLAPGAAAPDFTLRVTPDQYLSLRDLSGKPVVMAFYPLQSGPAGIPQA
jgi:peroxiredoxin